MTEAEWLTCTDPEPMLAFLKGKVSDRKAKLFAAAAFRLVARLLPDDRQSRAIELLEWMAEGTATPQMINRAVGEARGAIPAYREMTTAAVDDPYFLALMLYRSIVSSSRLRPDVLSGRLVNGAASHAAHVSSGVADFATAKEAQSRVLREILGNPFGNPFRPLSLDPNSQPSKITGLAQTIYGNRAFDRMPELADALALAGCTNADILGHCRGLGPHVRGCWVVDLILGKN